MRTTIVPSINHTADRGCHIAFIEARKGMTDVLKLFGVATVKYEQGHLYESRTGFVLIIQKLKRMEDAVAKKKKSYKAI